MLEVYNWGTFNGLARLEPLGGSALLTGANAAGKTTLVDALLTLMVPPGKRLYNQAAGGHKAEERNERTYIRGAWKKLQDADSSSSRDIYLRGTNSHSVLLAVFRRLIPEQAPEEITLAQLFWWEKGDTLRRLYLVARTALSLAEHFSPQRPLKLSELRQQLKSAGAELFDHFPPIVAASWTFSSCVQRRRWIFSTRSRSLRTSARSTSLFVITCWKSMMYRKN